MDSAFLLFFQQFRKAYIGEQAQKTTKVYATLSERLGLNDQDMLLNFIIRKLWASRAPRPSFWRPDRALVRRVTNLRVWSRSDSIIQKTLDELHVLTSGYSSLRLFARIDTVHLILRNFNARLADGPGRVRLTAAAERQLPVPGLPVEFQVPHALRRLPREAALRRGAGQARGPVRRVHQASERAARARRPPVLAGRVSVAAGPGAAPRPRLSVARVRVAAGALSWTPSPRARRSSCWRAYSATCAGSFRPRTRRRLRSCLTGSTRGASAAG
jgi:hypothetical protein